MFLVAGCLFNVGILVHFKYLVFFILQINLAFGTNINTVPFAVPFPLGISFCTFIALSYLIEIYRKKIASHVSFVDFGMFMTFFPHLIAGPIVRYTNIEDDINAHSFSLEMFYDGLCRFSVGLGKKVLLANNVGFIADKMFSVSSTDLTSDYAWLGALCYTFQIYYDFSGYSDMAIGLGRMLGFHFPENFNQPYRSSSITEFWKRWHITLSSWLRDFLYIPLGGNRKGNIRTYFNLMLVFLVCGLWHGAAWTFIVWGAYHGFFLIIERVFNIKFAFSPSGIFGRTYTFIAVAIGWIFFRSQTLLSAKNYILSLVNISDFSLSHLLYSRFVFEISNEKFVALIFATLFAFLPFERLNKFNVNTPSVYFIKSATILALCILSVLKLSTSGYNPFIYSKF